jgi:basic membrane protein A
MFKRSLNIGAIIFVLLIGIMFNEANGSIIFKVGMVTDSGTIDDKSFNQGTWEGIQRAGKEFKLETRFLKPEGTTEADYVKDIGNLYDGGFRMIICPGFKFETAIYQAQQKYKDAKFVLIDGQPHAGDFNPVLAENTVSILFAEHESSFLAGVATALKIREGEVGILCGMEIPPVQRFNWGFQQGIMYANDYYQTNVNIKPENVIYQGSFDNVAAGQQIAAMMFDKGVKVIFNAAAGTGIGAMNEAKKRVKVGQMAWVIGVDRDQYGDGIYEGNKSIILTSAMKRVDEAAYAMIKSYKEGEFPGGQTLVFNAKNNGIGLPQVNPNLSKEIQSKVMEVLEKMRLGRIVVSDKQGNLIK